MLCLHPVEGGDVVIDRPDGAHGVLHPPPRWVGCIARGLGGEVVVEAGDGAVEHAGHAALCARCQVLSTPAAWIPVSQAVRK